MSAPTTPRTYSIREAASLTGLPASTLRYYESIGVIPPISRGASSGHRVFTQGLFSRLREHDQNKSEDWDRFSWFCIEDIIKNDIYAGWAITKPRERISAVTDRILVRDAEALLILNLGTYKTGYQNRMSF